EAFFYLVFPPLLLLAAARRWRPALWALVLVAQVVLWLLFATLGWSPWALDYLPLSRLVQFAVGVLCGVAMRRGMRAPVDYGWAVVLVVGFHLCLPVWDLATSDLTRGWGPY